MSPIADAQAVADGDAAPGQRVEFLKHSRQVQRDARADDCGLARTQYAYRKQVQGEFLSVNLHGVAGIASAVVPDDNIEVLGEQVNNFALAFIAPVQADDTSVSKRAEIHVKTL